MATGLEGMRVEQREKGEGKWTGQRCSWLSLIRFLDPEQSDTNFGVADGPPHLNEYICTD